jgi:TonB family protein
LAVGLLSAQTREVSSDDAAGHLKKSVQAVYPQMAQIAHIMGDVTLRFTISKTGGVTDVQSVSGHPILFEAAKTAVKQWRYTPFEFSGHRTSVVTSVVITFPEGRPLIAQEKSERIALDQFYDDLLKCTMWVERKQFAKADPICRRAAAISSTLDPPQPLVQMEACKYMGHLLSFQGRGEEALQNYEQELAIADTAAGHREDQLAEAHFNVGNAKRGLDDLKGAVEHYEKAESIYRRISKDPDESVKNRNAYALWQVLRSHAELLRQMGQPDAAALLEHEAAGIVVEAPAPR